MGRVYFDTTHIDMLCQVDCVSGVFEAVGGVVKHATLLFACGDVDRLLDDLNHRV